MNADAQRHINNLRALTASTASKWSIDALAGIIRNLETEAATATAKLETATATIEGYAKDSGYTGPDTKAEFSEHLKDLVKSNVAKAALLREKDAEIKATREWKEEWYRRAHEVLADNERLTKQLAEAQQQSQPQPPNSYLAKEVERLQAENIELLKYKERMEFLEANKGAEPGRAPILSRKVFAVWPTGETLSDAIDLEIGSGTEQPLPCHTFQTYQPDPAEERAHERAQLCEKLKQVEAILDGYRDEVNSLRAERDRYAKIIDRLADRL